MTTTDVAPSSLQYGRDLGRAFGGALLFSFPLLMTMEMWTLGFEMDRVRLLVFVLLCLPLIYGLTRFAGFRRSSSLREDLLDTLAALFVGFVVAGVLLTLFGVLHAGQALDEVIGTIALQTAPAAIGAVLARKQLASGGREDAGDHDEPAGYPAELFLMAAGALFLVLNVAPTEEMTLIAYKMEPWHGLALAALSIGLLHAIVYSLGFAGQHAHEKPWLAFLHFTVPGYAIALLISLYVQWTFGHIEGQGIAHLTMTSVVLSFPGALGAGAARLLV